MHAFLAGIDTLCACALLGSMNFDRDGRVYDAETLLNLLKDIRTLPGERSWVHWLG